MYEDYSNKPAGIEKLSEIIEIVEFPTCEDLTNMKPDFDNIKALEEVPGKDWIHTNYGKHCVDDVIVTGYDECDFRHYYMVWLDRDVSDCCIYKVRKEHYPTFEDFNKAVTEYIHGLGYKINPIRQPNGWVRW